MHRELLPNLVTATIIPADELNFDTFLEQALAIYPKPPVIENETLKGYDKVGPVKKTEYETKLPIMKKHKPPLATPLSIEAAENKMSVAEAAKRAHLKLKSAADDMLRLYVIAAAEGYNMLKCCEEEVDITASRQNEAAIATRNEINNIDKKKLAELAKERARIEKLANKKATEKINKSVVPEIKE